MLSRADDQLVGPGQFQQIGVHRRTRHTIKLGRAILIMQPTRIFFPDGLHRPADFAVKFTDFEMLGQFHFAHQLMHGLARDHAFVRIIAHHK